VFLEEAVSLKDTTHRKGTQGECLSCRVKIGASTENDDRLGREVRGRRGREREMGKPCPDTRRDKVDDDRQSKENVSFLPPNHHEKERE